MSAFNASFSCGGGGTSGPTGTITSLVPPTDNIGEEGNLYIQFGIGGAKNRLYLKQDGVWVQYSGPRNSLTMNGVSQYAVAPRVEEIDFTQENLEFEIEYSSKMDHFNGYVLFQGNNTDTSDFMVYHPTPERVMVRFNYKDSDREVIFDGLDHSSMSVYRIKVSVVGTSATVTLFKDNSFYGEQTVPVAKSFNYTDNILCIGARYDNGSISLPFQGTLSNIRIWTGGDRNTGTLTRDYRMDEGWRGANNQVLVNYATELGEELVVNGDFSDGMTGWTIRDGDWEVVDGQAVLSGESPTNTQYLANQGTVNEQQQYLYSISTLSGRSLTPSLKDYTPNSSFITSESGDAVHAATGRGYGQFIVRSSVTVPLPLVIDSISVRQADGYGCYIGLTEASWTEETV